MKRTTVYLEDRQVVYLKERHIKTGIGVSEFIRRAIEAVRLQLEKTEKGDKDGR
jgi:Ribbon-helix-helix domain